MKIKKGTLLRVKHSRSGTWKGIATEDFDTEEEGFYPIALAQEVVTGMSTVWTEGDTMPAKKRLCTVSIIKKLLNNY